MATSTYADVYKSIKDNLNDGFEYDNKVKFQTKAVPGSKLTVNADVILGKSPKATIAFKKVAPLDNCRNFLVDKLQVSSDKTLNAEFSLTEVLPFTTLKFKAKDASRSSGASAIDATISADVEKNNVRFTFDVNPLKYDVDAAVVFPLDKYVKNTYIGVTGSVGLKNSVDFKNHNFLVAYNAEGFKTVFQTDAKVTKATLGFSSKYSNTTIFGQAKFPLAFAPANAVDVEVGARANAGKSERAIKLSSKGTVSVQNSVSLETGTLAVAAEVDFFNFASDQHKLGLTYTLASL